MFGITCAPELFQKIMEKMLIQCEGTLNFIDDIIIFGEDENQHDKRYHNTLITLKEHNVLLNESKCIHKVTKVQFLDNVLSKEGIKPLEIHVNSIKNFRAPATIEEIQSFLGLINFVGKWIPNLATLTNPIREILKLRLGKNANIEKFWSTDQNNAFQKLKTILSKDTTLGYYDPKDRTQVIADASPVGLGAVLIQFDKTGPRVIAYGNKSLSNCEKRYCQMEKEALALVWAVEHFHVYLYGKKEFELVTDHKPLQPIFGPKSKPCARIERWVLRLQSYRYEIVHRPGKSNIADPLSRLCSNQSSTRPFDNEDVIRQIVEYAKPIAISLQDIKKHSNLDEEILKVKGALMQNNWENTIKMYKVFEPELCVYNDILLRGNKIVIPAKLRQNVLEAAHEGHPGIVAMKARLRTKVWWPKIDKDAENFVKCCKGCTLISVPNPPNPMKRRELPSEPWIDVAMDFMGPLPNGYYILVVVDYYSRYKEIKTMKSITAANTMDTLREIFSRVYLPETITADNAKQFSNSEFRNYCKENNITLYHTIPYWPQQNGEVERQNRDILKRLKISQAMKRDWKKDLQEYLMMYNSTPHSTTGKTPSELFFRRLFRDKIPHISNSHVEDDEARDNDKLKKEEGREYSDRKRKAVENNLQPGDKVLVKNIIKDNKLTSNFNPTLHTVISKKGGDIQLQNDNTEQLSRRNIMHLKKVGDEWKILNEPKVKSSVN